MGIINKYCVYCESIDLTPFKNKNKCGSCGRSFLDKTFISHLKKIEIRKQVVKLYLEDGLSTTEIGKILGVSTGTPQNIIKELGISRTISESKKDKKRESRMPTEDIIKLYSEGLSSVKVSEQLGISKRSVLKILELNNIQRDNTYEYEHPKLVEIRDLYLKKESMGKIVKILGISYGAVRNVLKKLGIIRTEDRYHLGVGYENYLISLPIYKRYRTKVENETIKQKISMLKYYNKRGRSGVDGAYQLDHRYSILEGFKNDIPPEIIGNINNLKFIPWKVNQMKGSKCSITIEELMKRVK